MIFSFALKKILTHCVMVVVLSTSSALSTSAELLLLLLLAFKSNEKSLSLPSFHSLKISSASWLSSPSGRKGLSQPWYELQNNKKDRYYHRLCKGRRFVCFKIAFSEQIITLLGFPSWEFGYRFWTYTVHVPCMDRLVCILAKNSPFS